MRRLILEVPEHLNSELADGSVWVFAEENYIGCDSILVDIRPKSWPPETVCPYCIDKIRDESTSPAPSPR